MSYNNIITYVQHCLENWTPTAHYHIKVALDEL